MVTPTAVTQDPAVRLTVNDIQRILIDHDNGYPPAVIAKRSGADEQQCEAIIDASRQIASIRSNKGRPRLITQRRRKQFHGEDEPLCPSSPPGEQDVQLASRMIQRLWPLIPQTGTLGDIAPALEHFLNHVEANNSGVRFYRPQEATLFVELLAEIADDRRTIFGTHVHSVQSRLDAAEQRARWEKHLRIRVRNDDNRSPLKRDGGRYGKLTVSLELSTVQGKPVSAHAYKYVLHLAAIELLWFGRIRFPHDPQQPIGATTTHEEVVPDVHD